ncbi:hypothetical protein Nepgr_011864 [Nepenthes gracilis]|uniref:Uncharacterized protein n=1 Tax=Nepenthes gracilis TaxID=150966 RepID=A0AAD3SEU8_NEPGR|nr:hypothetical protein Nepgr_011864 [Nepenthes gracilis]
MRLETEDAFGKLKTGIVEIPELKKTTTLSPSAFCSEEDRNKKLNSFLAYSRACKYKDMVADQGENEQKTLRFKRIAEIHEYGVGTRDKEKLK